MSARRPRHFARLVPSVAALVAFGCGGSSNDSASITSNPPSSNTPIPVSIVIQPTSATIAVGGTVQLSATVLGSSGTSSKVDQAVTWHSLSPARMSVSASGLVTGLAAGQGTINASAASFPTVFSGATVTITP